MYHPPPFISTNTLSLLPFYLLLFSILFLFFAFILITLKYLILTSITKKQFTLLEITTPHDIQQSPFSTEQLFLTLHNLGKSVSFKDKLLKRKRTYSLEIVATGENGIRFLLRTNPRDAGIIKKNILSYLPHVLVTEVEDYFPETFGQYKRGNPKTFEMKMENHFAYPLQRQTVLKEHDPIGYITGHMTKLEAGDVMAVQIAVTPLTRGIHTKEINEVGKLKWLLKHGRDMTSTLHTPFRAEYILPILLVGLPTIFYMYFILLTTAQRTIVNAVGLIAIVALWFFWNPTKLRKEEELSKEQIEIQGEIVKKIQDGLLEVSLRTYFQEGKPGSMNGRIEGVLSYLRSSTHTPYQSLKVKQNIPFQRYTYFLLKNRFLSYKNNLVLSISELASLYHFPFTPTTQTEDLIHTKSPQLPVPFAVKTDKEKLSVVFAHNSYGGKQLPVGLTRKDRQRHMYILGGTGTGKTTMLKTMILQDITQGEGVALLDPHGDFVEEVLAAIPSDRIKDVVYFNPADRKYPVGINFLEIPKELSEDEREMEKDIITSNLISVFAKISSSKSWGPRMEHMLRNATLTALSTENPSIITIHRLLLDYQYRKGIVSKLKDPVLKMFWEKEFARLGSYQKSEVIAPVLNKLERFLTSPISRSILGQTKSTINFTDIMDKKKILLCNLSKGKIGEDISMLFGALLTAKIQLTALKRTDMPEEERKDFYLYIDEFQNFATPSFAQIMSESRKYHLYAILAHQTTAQIEDKDLLKVILANTGILVSFRTSSTFDESFILPNFAPQVVEGDIHNLPSFNFYMKLQAINPQNTFSGQTFLPDFEKNDSVKNEIIENSRKLYGNDKATVEKEILEALTYIEEQPQPKQTRNRRPKAPEDKSIS